MATRPFSDSDLFNETELIAYYNRAVLHSDQLNTNTNDSYEEMKEMDQRRNRRKTVKQLLLNQGFSEVSEFEESLNDSVFSDVTQDSLTLSVTTSLQMGASAASPGSSSSSWQEPGPLNQEPEGVDQLNVDLDWIEDISVGNIQAFVDHQESTTYEMQATCSSSGLLGSSPMMPNQWQEARESISTSSGFFPQQNSGTVSVYSHHDVGPGLHSPYGVHFMQSFHGHGMPSPMSSLIPYTNVTLAAMLPSDAVAPETGKMLAGIPYQHPATVSNRPPQPTKIRVKDSRPRIPRPRIFLLDHICIGGFDIDVAKQDVSARRIYRTKIMYSAKKIMYEFESKHLVSLPENVREASPMARIDVPWVTIKCMRQIENTWWVYVDAVPMVYLGQQQKGSLGIVCTKYNNSGPVNDALPDLSRTSIHKLGLAVGAGARFMDAILKSNDPRLIAGFGLQGGSVSATTFVTSATVVAKPSPKRKTASDGNANFGKRMAVRSDSYKD